MLDSTVVFNEIMYHPPSDDAPGATSLEWIEIYNQMSVNIDLSGWRLSDGVDYTFRNGVVLEGGEYLIIAADPDALAAATGFTGAFGPYTGRLANSGEHLELSNANDRVMNTLDYGDNGRWPVGPDGGGITLAKKAPGFASEDAGNWTSSREIGGTPGKENFELIDPGPPPPAFDSLVLEIDPIDGTATIINAATTSIEFGGYSIGSESGSLNPADEAWQSLQDAGVGAWEEAAPTSNLLTELNPDGSLTLTPGQTISLGQPFRVPAGTTDLTFEFFEEIQGVVVQGGVDYGQDLVAPENVSINEIASSIADSFWVELYNSGTTPISLRNYVISSTEAGASDFILTDQTIDAGGFLVLGEAELGFGAESADRVFLHTKGKGALVDAAAVKKRPLGRSPDGVGIWQTTETPTPGSENVFAFHDEIVINEIMFNHRPQFPQSGTFVSTTLLPMVSQWRYYQDGDPGDGWNQPQFNASAWPTGDALLFAESASLPAAKSTQLELGETAYYFRTTITIDDLSAISSVEYRTIIDDGAVIYINGQEVSRFNMNAGEISHGTLASVGVVNATLSTPVTIPTELLVVGENVIAVEVHQNSAGSSDVVFGMEITSLVADKPSLEFQEIDEEWIELFNRSDQAVDLSGWELDDAVSFVFAPGTIIGPGGYIVISNNPVALAAKFESLDLADIAGEFSGSLSNDNEEIILKDANKNLVDQVHYFGGVNWPEFSDGGGSSLELRDPFADNTKAEAWEASDESLRSQWQHYSYRATPQSQRFDPPINFNEFVLGLLDSGEVLLDNVSVLRFPGARPSELLQNTSFERDVVDHLISEGVPADKWRIQGTHDRSRVAIDPDNPENKVLHLIADGRTNYLSNHAETTLAGGAKVDNGTEYEISFDAKWIGGSPQLRTALYYKDAARTTILTLPDESGTPGARNSTYETNIGPTYSGLTHFPIIPNSSEPVTVSVLPSDLDGIGSVVLHYGREGTNFQTVTMTPDRNGLYSGQIPAQSNGSVVQFYVEGADAAPQSATSMFPAAGPESRALYRVSTENVRPVDRHHFRIIMIAADRSFLHKATNILSNNRMGGTVIYDGQEVFYDIGVRLRGSMFSRSNQGGTGFNVQFHPDQRFRGVHETVTMKTVSKREILIKHVATQVGLPGAMYDDLIDLRKPTGSGDGVATLSMARQGDEYLENQFENGADGTLFKMEGIRVMQNNTGSERIKTYMPIGWVGNFDITDLGDDKELYRWPYLINRNRDKDDYEPIIAMAKAFSKTGADLEQAVAEVLDVDEWMKTFALMSLGGIGDTYSQGNPHNLNFYVQPSDGKILAMPWDWDFTFSRSATSPLWGGKNIRKVIERPVYTRLFYGHLQDMISTFYNTDYMRAWTTHYGQTARESYSGHLSYIGQRGNFVLSRLPAEVPFRIGSADPLNVGSTSVATISGQGWINVREIRLAGEPQPLDVTWLDGDSWEISLPVDRMTGEVTFEAYDFQGALIGSDSITIVSSATRPILDQLRVTEIMYNPAGNDDVEFMELANISEMQIDSLQGVSFINGIDFTFPDVALAPGERIVVVRNQLAFEALYGDAINVAGEYTGTALDNNGERIVLADADGAVVQDFRYLDNEPGWHPTTDGGGFSLEIVDATAALTAWSDPTGWRASSVVGGTPGTEQVGLGGDLDGDGNVGVSDVAIIQSQFGDVGPAVADLDGDGAVTVADFRMLVTNFGRSIIPAPAASVSRVAPSPIIDESAIRANSIKSTEPLSFPIVDRVFATISDGTGDDDLSTDRDGSSGARTRRAWRRLQKAKRSSDSTENHAVDSEEWLARLGQNRAS